MAYVKELIIDIATMKMNGYSESEIVAKLNVPKSWVHGEVIDETIKVLKGS